MLSNEEYLVRDNPAIIKAIPMEMISSEFSHEEAAVPWVTGVADKLDAAGGKCPVRCAHGWHNRDYHLRTGVIRKHSQQVIRSALRFPVTFIGIPSIVSAGHDNVDFIMPLVPVFGRKQFSSHGMPRKALRGTVAQRIHITSIEWSVSGDGSILSDCQDFSRQG